MADESRTDNIPHIPFSFASAPSVLHRHSPKSSFPTSFSLLPRLQMKVRVSMQAVFPEYPPQKVWTSFMVTVRLPFFLCSLFLFSFALTLFLFPGCRPPTTQSYRLIIYYLPWSCLWGTTPTSPRNIHSNYLQLTCYVYKVVPHLRNATEILPAFCIPHPFGTKLLFVNCEE